MRAFDAGIDGLQPRERPEQPVPAQRLDDRSTVAHREMQGGAAARILPLPRQQADRAGLAELYRVGQQVDQHLAQPAGIGIKLLRQVR